MNMLTDSKPFAVATSLTISNQVEEMAKVQPWLEQLAKYYQLPESAVFKLDLVLNEALPNIIFYAFQDCLNHAISIKIENHGDTVILEIIDDGVPFDPFEQEAFSFPTSLESASVDGRGIHLINSFTDTREYQRIDDTNVLRLGINKAPKADKQSEATTV